jgi:hypothetical protein
MTLYELTDELLTILAMAEDDDDDEALKGSWEAVNLEYNDKIEGYCKVVKQMEADCYAIREEEKRLADRRKRIERRIEWMKGNIKISLEAVGKRKAGGKLFTASIRANGGQLPLVVEAKAEELPAEFRKIEFKADNAAIREALEAGRELEFAHFGERGETVNIK